MNLPSKDAAKNWGLLILTVAVVILILTNLKSCEAGKNQAAVINAYQDTLHQTRDKLGRQTTSIAVLETNVKTLLSLNAEKDSTLKWLQEVVKENKKANAAIVARIEALDKGSSATTIVVKPGDTVKTDSGTIIYPTYKTQWDEEWSKGTIEASKDSIKREITYTEKYEVTLSDKGNGLFKPKTYTVSWKNLNPYANTTGLRSYTFKPKAKRFFVGVGLGYGVNLTPTTPVRFTHGIQLGIYGGVKIFEF